jgi:hypothetical protein
MVSMAGEGRAIRSVRTEAGTALRAASVASAASRPLSRAGGWMLRVTSRSSTMASVALR